MTETAEQITPATTKGWISLPTLDSPDQTVRGWMDQHINVMSHRRRYHTQRAALNLWFYLGRQWIEARAELAPGNGVYHFAEIYRNSLAAFPRPWTNLIATAVDNEVARLGRKEFVPDAQPEKNKPEWMAAARLAKDIVNWEMGKSLWEQKREDLSFNMLIDAVTILRTWWDENDTELALIASGETATCPGCGARFASRQVPRAFSTLAAPTAEGPREMLHRDSLRDIEAESGEASALHPQGIPLVEMKHCPLCDEAQELTSYPINPKEANEEDVYGRQLGMFVPQGNSSIEPISLHEFFPDNGGLHVEPHEQVIFQQMSVRSLEYIALRYPEFADKLTPEEPRELIRLNPIYAEPLLSGYMGYNLSVGRESYYNHARLKEVIIDPHPHIEGLQHGAIFASVGDQISRKELMVEVEGKGGPKYIPRVRYHFARFKRWPKSFWSRTVVDDLIPIQRRLNELDAQMIDIRERGAPNMWLPEGTTLYTRDDVQGSVRFFNYDSPDPNWTPQAGMFPGIPMSGNPYTAERDRILQDAQMVGAPQDIEVGQAPGSVKTTSGLMLLSEEAAQKRGPRERAMTRMFESAFEHVLAMNWAFRKEDTSYEIQKEASVYERKSYTGTDLLGPMRVKMVARAGYDQTLYNKEAAGEALTSGVIQITSPDQVDRLLELMKLPKDLNERDHIQVQRAEEAWSDFVHQDKVHVPDLTIEHPVVWYAVLSKRWFSDESVILQREVGWDDILPQIANWEEFKGQIEMQEMEQKPIYAAIPPDQWGTVYDQGEKAVAAAMESYQKAMESHASTIESAPPGSEPMDMPEPPHKPIMETFPKPPEHGFLPEALEQRIFEVWMRMLPTLRPGMRAAVAADKQGTRIGGSVKKLLKLRRLLQIRGVIESYRMTVMQVGGPAPPGPGPGGGAPAPGGGGPPGGAAPAPTA